MMSRNLTVDNSFDSSNSFMYNESDSSDVLSNQEFDNFISSDYFGESQGMHLKSYSARVLDWDEYKVKTEWLINREEAKYQVRSFPIQMFENTSFLKHGQLLKVFISVKRGEMKLKFEDGTKLISKTDFSNEQVLTGLKSNLFNFK